jgi:hypothetical protein
VAVVAAAAAVVAAHAPAPLRSNPMVGLVRWHAGGSDVVVLGGAGGRAALGARPVLEALRREHVGAIELLVVADERVPAATVAAVAGAHAVGEAIGHGAAPSLVADVPLSRSPPVDTTVEVGDLVVRLVPLPDRLVVDARPRG